MHKIKKFKFHIISHTHWDREWYLPFETFRSELVDLMDDLLNILKQNSSFIFHLDGYSLLLEDYLEIKPHNKELIKKYVKSGNILVGPWYVLSDEFLTSGESTIRNLLYGIEIANEFGKVMNIGYMPDEFGHIAQMPQILNGFNIKSAVIARGIQDKFAEHKWQALNDDEVLVIALTHWYNNAQNIPHKKKDLVNYLNNIYKKQAKTSLSGNLLLMNGCDHLFPEADFLKTIKLLGKPQNFTVKQTNLPGAIREINENLDKKKLPVRHGELRDDNDGFILASTLSSRVYLKLFNFKLQTRLEKIIEPLSSMLSLLKLSEYPFYKVKYAWKSLIQNHAHDSICGCSHDLVHREMETRFEKINQITSKIYDDLLSNLRKNNDQESKNHIQIINTTQYVRNEPIEVELEFPLSFKAKHGDSLPKQNKNKITNLSIFSNDKKIEFEILESKIENKMLRSKYDIPLLQLVQKIRLLANVSSPSFSVTSCKIDTSKKASRINTLKIKKQSFGFENGFYKLNINLDGSLNLFLKENKKIFKNLHCFSLENDNGNLYHFFGKENLKKSPLKFNISVLEENDLRKVFLLESINLPGADLTVKVICYRDLEKIDFKTSIKNENKNKRLRIHFPTNLNKKSMIADTPFGFVERKRPSFKNGAFVQPLHDWILHRANNFGLAFFGNGISEYELYKNGNGFAVTLIRSIGKLSHVKSHSFIQTPEGQCERTIDFSYSIFPFSNSHTIHDVYKSQLNSSVPLISNHASKNIEIQSLCEIPESLVVSAFKRSEEDENTYILRLFNPSDKKIEGLKVKLNYKFKKVQLLNLNETPIRELPVKQSEITFTISNFEIISIGFIIYD